MGPQQALTGRKVYGQGSYAPTKGRVSANGAQGYLQRTVRQNNQPGNIRRVGRDGQSDTRSGVAAAAGQRRAAAAGPGNWHQAGGGGGQQQQGPGRKAYNNQGRQLVGGGAASAAATVSNGNMAPNVTVNNNGQLELPYSPAWSQELYESMGQYNQDLAAIQGDEQTEALEYEQANRQAGIQNKQQKLTSVNTAGGGGTAFSSAYGVQASNDANNYQNTINDLLATHNAQTTAHQTEKDAIVSAFKAQLQGRSLQYAEEVAENAGTLGYGQAKNRKRPYQNASSNGPRAHAAQQAVKNKNKKPEPKNEPKAAPKPAPKPPPKKGKK